MACPDRNSMDLPWFAEIMGWPNHKMETFTMSVKVEGTVPLRDCDLGGEVLAGYDGDGLIDMRPAVLLHWHGGEPLAITTEFEEDTLLLIRDPQGGWHFNDNGREHNPLVVLDNPRAGTYAIYIGSHLRPPFNRPGELIMTQTGP